MHLYAWAHTDVGRKRHNNQDAMLIHHESKLLVVADGMGGHLGGEVASALAVTTIRDAACAGSLRDAFADANARIHARAQAEPHLHRMGTTASAVRLCGSRANIAHVGDSRVYLLRNGVFHQLTRDHSVVEEHIRAGVMTREQAKASPFRNVLSRAMGVEPEVDVDVDCIELCHGDTLLLCSDGLCGVLSDEEMANVVRAVPPFVAPRTLVACANECGGPDNITAVVACIVDSSL
jgi:PPM family protein phosphatase